MFIPVPAKVQRIYATITLSRTTTAYFIAALLSSFILAVLQIVAYDDNSQASDLVADILTMGDVTKGIVVASSDGQRLRICDDLPFFDTTTCWILVDKGRFTYGNATEEERKVFGERRSLREPSNPLSRRDWELRDAFPVLDPLGRVEGVNIGKNFLDRQCLNSLLWLDNMLRDSMKEDIVILFFHVWLLVLSVVAIMMESVPHLGAALCGHILAVSWGGYRVSNSQHLEWLYKVLIVDGACQMDLLKSWWALRNAHTVPVVVVNSLSLVAMLYFSVCLYKTFTKQSLGRVGTSEEIRHVYKLVSLLSVFLQLAGFFLLASTSIWIAKASTGVIKAVAYHLPLYLAGFGITAVLAGPWATLGWFAIRRERRRLFWVFCGISLLLLGIGTAYFASPLYMFIFMGWPFFATITVTSFILLVITVTMAMVCRMYFGLGLAHFLQVSEALEGIGFTEANFPNSDEKSPTKYESEWLDKTKSNVKTYSPPGGGKLRVGSSIYSDDNKSTIHVSTTPSWARSQKSRLSSQTKFSQRLSVVSGESVVNFVSSTLGGKPKQAPSAWGGKVTSEVQGLGETGVPPLPRPQLAQLGPARKVRRSRPNLSVDTKLASNQANALVAHLHLNKESQRG